MRTDIRLLLVLVLASLTSACSLLETEPSRPKYRRADSFALAARPNVQAPVAQMKSAHPRLLVSEADFAQARQLSATDPTVVRWMKDVRNYADTAVNRPPLDWAGTATIENARNLEQRIMHLALMWRLTGDQKYLSHARDELLSCAAAPNWDGNSFLITAETTTGMAIGYDWLFNDLADADRRVILNAIETKGLERGRRAYAESASWVQARHNWNLVCNGGMMLGAIAIYDEDPSAARSIIDSARSSVLNGFSNFAPDGGWEEGPTYWNYATRFACYLLSSLNRSMGVSFNATDFPGFSETGDYRIQMIGPTGKAFNYADSGEVCGRSPQMFYLAKTFNRPEYAAFERLQTDTPTVMDVLWYMRAPAGTKSDQAIVDHLPTAALFRGPEVVTFRGAWGDPNTTFLGAKGGSAKAHHGHLDLGSFVLDAMGQRFALDLGADKYSLPGYSGEQRFNYYRTRNEGHNTLTFNSKNQNLDADAAVVAFHASGDLSSAVIDLTSAYDQDARRVQRGFALLHGTDVLVQDEIEPKDKSNIWWTMHTEADIRLDGATARLVLNNQTLTARILSPAGARFETAPANAPAPQTQQPNVHRLLIHLSVSHPTQLIVQFTPGDHAPIAAQIEPLSHWANDRNLAESRPPVEQKESKSHKKQETEPEPDLAPVYVPHQTKPVAPPWKSPAAPGRRK